MNFLTDYLVKLVTLSLYYGTISSQESADTTSNSSEGKENSSGSGESGNSNPNEKPISAKNGIENIGMAVFKEDKLVGTLDAEETLCHLLLTNHLKSCNLSVPDPENSNKEIDLFLSSNHSSKVNVSIINGTPHIKVKVLVNAKLSSIDNISHTMTEERLHNIEDSASNYLKNIISNYLYKTSKELNSDAPGFGKFALAEFKTVKEFEEYDWLNHYQDSFFNVEANVSIKSSFLLTET